MTSDIPDKTKQSVNNLYSAIVNKISNLISIHNSDTNSHPDKAPKNHASSSTDYGISSSQNYGHAKAGGSPQAIGKTLKAGTDNGIYARADHIHTVAYENVSGTPDIPEGSSEATDIQMDGTRAAGSSEKFARADHVHPTDTSRAAASHTHVKNEITDFSHTHGNIQNDGVVKVNGTTQASKNVCTDANGNITTENKNNHSHGSIASGGTLNSDITEVNKIAVTNSSNQLKTISNLPSSKISEGTALENIGTEADVSQHDINDAIDGKISDLQTNKSDITHNHDNTYINDDTGTVTSNNIADGTIVNGDIANTTITGGKLVNETITATQLASNAVETAKIKDANVTTAKISDSAITSAKIADGTIVNDDIKSDASIDFSKLNITKNDIVNLGIPSQDTNTVYTHPSYTARTGKPTGNQTPAFGGTATVSQITSDASGHVTGATDRTIKIPNTLADGTTAGLSTNDYTTTEKTKLSGIATGANKTTVDNALSSTSTNPLQNKAIYTAIQNLQNGIASIELIEIVTTLPTSNISTQKLYFKRNDDDESENLYDIYAYVNDDWEHIDALNIDISEYLKKADLGAGTGLSKSGTTLNHSNSISPLTTAGLKSIKVDAQGHITEISNPPYASTETNGIVKLGTTSTTAAKGDHSHSNYLTSHQDISGKENTSNKTSSWKSTTNNTRYPTEKLVKDSLDTKENTSNKSTNITSSSTDTQYPSAKAVYSYAQPKGNYLTSHNPIDTALSSTSTNAVQNKIINSALSGKAASSHTHPDTQITLTGNVSNGVSPLDMATGEIFSANRLAYLPPENITIKYSTNNGSTWTDYGASNDNKAKLVSSDIPTGTSFIAGKDATASINNRLYIDIDAGGGDLSSGGSSLYMGTKKLMIYFSTGGGGNCKVQVQTALYNTPTTFTTKGTYDIAGYPGWNSIPLQCTFGGYKDQTDHIKTIRLIFYRTADAKNFTVYNIRLFGETAWSTPSNMAKYGHIYSYDINQNATFPGKIIKSGGTNTQLLLANGDTKGTGDFATSGHTHSNATTSTAGFMSKDDKTKLDGIATGANKTTIANNLTTTTAGSALDATQGKALKTAVDGKSTVSVSPTKTSGVEIGRITVDGTEKILYQQDNNTTYSNATTSTAGLMSKDDKSKLNGITASADAVSFSQTKTSGIEIGKITINGTATSIYQQDNNTTYSNATTSTAGLMSKDDKTKLDGIDTGANAYTHPSYTARTGVPTANATLSHGGTFTVSQPVTDATGHVTALNTRTYTLPADNNTTYSAEKGITLSSGKFGHSNTAITAGTNYNGNQTPAFGATFNIPKLTYDTYGHITASANSTVKIPSLPTASTDTAGIIQIGNGASNAAAGNHTHTTLTTGTLTGSTTESLSLSSTTTPGWYIVKRLDRFADTPASSSIQYGYLEVKNYSSDTLIQTLYTLNSSVAPEIYYRRKYSSGSFPTTWIKVINSNDTASTSKAGVVQLNNTITSTSTTEAATANAVKTAYDLANGKPSLGTTASTAAKGNHTHGNITNAGAIGSTANKPIITTTSGKLTTGSFGTTANTFCEGDDSRLSDARTPLAHTHEWKKIGEWGTANSNSQYYQLMYINEDANLIWLYLETPNMSISNSSWTDVGTLQCSADYRPRQTLYTRCILNVDLRISGGNQLQAVRYSGQSAVKMTANFFYPKLW